MKKITVTAIALSMAMAMTGCSGNSSETTAASEAETTAETEGLEVTVSKAHDEKCERCWAYSDTVGKDEKHPTLCARCAAIIG